MTTPTRAHPKCQTEAGHVCQEPSGRRCDTQPCDQPAGTNWSPYWCPMHDEERQNRISDSFDEIQRSFR